MMRRLIPAAAVLALLAFQAQAQTAPDSTQAPATTTAPQPKPAVKRITLQQRFDAANTTHDGHLTKDQATAANWPYVASNFVAIDKDKRGYVTVQDIRVFAKARRAARQQTPAPGATPPTNG